MMESLLWGIFVFASLSAQSAGRRHTTRWGCNSASIPQLSAYVFLRSRQCLTQLLLFLFPIAGPQPQQCAMFALETVPSLFACVLIKLQLRGQCSHWHVLSAMLPYFKPLRARISPQLSQPHLLHVHVASHPPRVPHPTLHFLRLVP